MDNWGERRGDWVNVCGGRNNLSQRLEREERHRQTFEERRRDCGECWEERKEKFGGHLVREKRLRRTFGEIEGEILINVCGVILVYVRKERRALGEGKEEIARHQHPP